MDVSIRELEDGIYCWDVPLLSGDVISYIAKLVRLQSTGYHGWVGIAINKTILEYDTFNLSRSEERGRLTKAARANLSGIAAEECSLEMMRRQLGAFCEAVPSFHEDRRFEEVIPDVDIDAPIESIRIILDPYVVDGAGTVFFGPPGGGKSYTAHLVALMIGTGCKDIWPVHESRPVLWVNLERGADLVMRRHKMLCRCFQVQGTHHGITFIHGKGMSLTTVQRKIQSWCQRHTGGVVFLDSISRSGQGSMNKDDVANSITDMLNQSAPTWVAIGHTPRENSDHQFGSVMFEAAEDIGVKLSSEEKIEGKSIVLGVSLMIKKANDIRKGQPSYIAFIFQDDELWLVRQADRGEFSQLLLSTPKSAVDKIKQYLFEVNTSTATEIAKAIDLPRSHVSELLNGNDAFVRISKVGKEVFFAVKSDQF